MLLLKKKLASRHHNRQNTRTRPKVHFCSSPKCRVCATRLSYNLVGRIQIGAVVYFLDFHWRSIHWPAFNLADVFIVCFMLVWCFASLKSSSRPSTRKTPEELSS